MLKKLISWVYSEITFRKSWALSQSEIERIFDIPEKEQRLYYQLTNITTHNYRYAIVYIPKYYKWKDFRQITLFNKFTFTKEQGSGYQLDLHFNIEPVTFLLEIKNGDNYDTVILQKDVALQVRGYELHWNKCRYSFDRKIANEEIMLNRTAIKSYIELCLKMAKIDIANSLNHFARYHIMLEDLLGKEGLRHLDVKPFSVDDEILISSQTK